MKPDTRAKRTEGIMQAAYEVLAEKGYAGTSMLAVARRASASNETLYKWYGNKQGLFRAMVVENARAATSLLRESLQSGDDPADVLAQVGPLLLRLVTADEAIALNRAAAGDATDTGTLGRTIAESGREAVVPLIEELFERAARAGHLEIDDAAEATEAYLALFIGDLQIRRVIGVQPPLTQTQIRERAARAQGLLERLYGA